MTSWLLAVEILLVLGLGPAFVLATRGSGADRLVGVELASAVSVGVLLLLSQSAGQSYYYIVPLVLAILSFTGSLVYTRLLRPQR